MSEIRLEAQDLNQQGAMFLRTGNAEVMKKLREKSGAFASGEEWTVILEAFGMFLNFKGGEELLNILSEVVRFVLGNLDDMENDFYSIIDDVGSKIIGSNAFKSDNMINTDVLDKISPISTIDISIPEVYVPEINLSFNVA